MLDLPFDEDALLREMNKYCKNYDELNTKFSSISFSYEYGYGSQGGGHRGYYSPSPIEEIVVGGVKRGKITTHLQRISNYQFRYCFDEKNQLCIVERYWDQDCGAIPILYSKEFLIVDGQTTIAPTYDVICLPEISGISVCKYNDSNHIINYGRLLCYLENPELSGHREFHFEKYTYDSNGLLDEAYSGERIGHYKVLSKYKFRHDADGKLNGYECFDADGNLTSIHSVPKVKQRKI